MVLPEQNCSVSLGGGGACRVLLDASRVLPYHPAPLASQGPSHQPSSEKGLLWSEAEGSYPAPQLLQSVWGSPTASTRGTPRNRCKLPTPQRHPLSSHSPEAPRLPASPLAMNSHLSRHHEGSGPGVWEPRGPEHRHGLVFLSGETASSPCTSGASRAWTRRGGLHVSRWRFPSLALHSRLPPREHALPGRPCRRAVTVGRQEPKGFSPASPGALLYSGSASCALAASRAVPLAGPDCRAQTLGSPVLCVWCLRAWRRP